MIIQDELFGKTIRIDVSKNEQQYIVQKRKGNRKNGDPYWRSLYFCSTLKSAIKHIMRMRVYQDGQVVTLKEYVDRYENAYKEIEKRLNI